MLGLKCGDSVGVCGRCAASKVFLLEPSVDPAIEQQAIGRVHRIGQQRPVSVYRLVTVDTVEVRPPG